jgi:hypothetical protein
MFFTKVTKEGIYTVATTKTFAVRKSIFTRSKNLIEDDFGRIIEQEKVEGNNNQ